MDANRKYSNSNKIFKDHKTLKRATSNTIAVIVTFSTEKK